MGNGSGVSRGDRNRNAKLSRLRELVPVTNAIVGIDLADNKQMVVVCDHDSKVLARRTFRCRAWGPRWTGQPSVRQRRDLLARRCLVSRPGTAGGSSGSSRPSGRCRLCVCSRR